MKCHMGGGGRGVSEKCKKSVTYYLNGPLVLNFSLLFFNAVKLLGKLSFQCKEENNEKYDQLFWKLSLFYQPFHFQSNLNKKIWFFGNISKRAKKFFDIMLKFVEHNNWWLEKYTKSKFDTFEETSEWKLFISFIFFFA